MIYHVQNPLHHNYEVFISEFCDSIDDSWWMMHHSWLGFFSFLWGQQAWFSLPHMLGTPSEHTWMFGAVEAIFLKKKYILNILISLFGDEVVVKTTFPLEKTQLSNYTQKAWQIITTQWRERKKHRVIIFEAFTQ